MENRNTINFFWSGDGWTYLHDLTIKSHIVVGHKPRIWLHGNLPKSKYWNYDVYKKYGVINNADDIVNVRSFIEKGGNWKTASSLWRFLFLYEHGGWYADTDAVAIKEWPKDKWVLCKNYKEMLSTGVLKVPSGRKMFLGMIEDLQFNWGNVKVFNHHYQLRYGNTNETIDGKLFFPFTWEEWKVLINANYDNKILDGFSIHLYHTMFERAKMIDNIEILAKNKKDTLLGKIHKWVNESLLVLEQGDVELLASVNC